MKPSAPELATAATSSARPTHCRPPCTTGCSTPNVSVNFVVSVIRAPCSSVLSPLRASAHWCCLLFAQALIGVVSSSRKRSSGCHPNRAVEADHLTVEHRVFHDVHGQRTVLVGLAQPRRVRHLLAQRLLGRLGQARPQRRGEQATWG